MTFKLGLFLLGIAVLGATILFLINIEKGRQPKPAAALDIIVYVCDDGDQEICAIRTDGTGFIKLTDNNTDDYRPAINRHGRIAFICNQPPDSTRGDLTGRAGLCSIQSDGSGFVNISGNHYPLNFSEYPVINDLDEIFYICFDDELEVEICAIRSDGTGSKILTDNEWTEFSLSTNSASKLAFICVPGKSASFFDTEICEMERDGTGFRQLTHNSLIEWGTAINDTNLIVSNCDKELLQHLGLCLIYPPNGRFVQLSTSTTSNLYGLNNTGQIVFQCQDDHDAEICLTRSDGAGLAQLTDNEIDDKMPAINDAGVVAYRCGVDLCVINADGSGYAKLTDQRMLKPVEDMRIFVK